MLTALAASMSLNGVAQTNTTDSQVSLRASLDPPAAADKGTPPRRHRPKRRKS